MYNIWWEIKQCGSLTFSTLKEVLKFCTLFSTLSCVVIQGSFRTRCVSQTLNIEENKHRKTQTFDITCILEITWRALQLHISSGVLCVLQEILRRSYIMCKNILKLQSHTFKNVVITLLPLLHVGEMLFWALKNVGRCVGVSVLNII